MRQPITDDSVGGSVIAIELGRPDQAPLEGWSPGAHIDVETQDESGRPVTRQYSLCGEQNGPTWRVAVLAEKMHDRRVEGVEADFAGVEVPDRYVFGYGMDLNEQGRNLPAIYALGE